MKRIRLITLFTIFIMILSFSMVFAESDEYIITKNYIYKNFNSAELQRGFVEIKLGTVNESIYGKDIELKITPSPDEIREDEYGNQYIYYNLKGLGANQEFSVEVKRTIEIDTYTDEVLKDAKTEVTEENEIYIKPQTMIESDNSKIIKKAKSLISYAETDYEKAYKIFEFVNTELTYDINKLYANMGAIAALENKRGVCEEFATLYTALCRAVDIPTRCVTGYKLKTINTGEIELINHVWCEVFFKDYGWLPIEPTVVYTLNGERTVYEKSFCKMLVAEYLPTGLYNTDKPDRVMLGVEETSYKENLMRLEDVKEEETTFNFTDVTEGYAWCKDAISRLYNYGIIKGYDDTTYGPERNISRIEFICMLSRTLKTLNTPSDSKSIPYYYLEYDTSHWSKEDYDYLMKCYQYVTPSDKVSAGYYNLANVFDNTLLADKSITRAEVVALLDAFLDDEDSENIFKDVVNNKFIKSILKAYSNELIMGYPDGTFRPNGLITRAEMAVILDRFINNNTYTL